MENRNVLLKTCLLILFGIWMSFTANAQWMQMGNDIDGEAAGDLSGLSVSMNESGNRVAVGAIFNADNGVNAGKVRVYENLAGIWIQIGSDIDGESAGDLSGYSVSMNAAGDIVAIGAPENDDNGSNAGQVRIYEYDGSDWTQLGDDIDGVDASDKCGLSVALNAVGNIIVIGAPENDDAGADAGHVRVFENIAGVWTQIGADIDGEAAGDNCGFSVHANASGSIVAIGAPANSGTTGHVRIFENLGGVWTQIGADIDGEAAGDFSGWSVNLNDAGNILAVGAPFNSGNGIAAGNVKVFENTGGVWSQVGSDIDGEVANDRSGISVSLNADGDILSIGAYKNKDSGVNSGQVRIFENETGSWAQVGDDILGESDQERFGWSVSLNGDGSIVAASAPYNSSDQGQVRAYCFADLLIFLKDSNGDPLPGGMVEFRDGTWQIATELSDGVFCVNSDRNNVKVRTTYEDATLLQTIPTDANHTIQTVLTTFELRKKDGSLGYNWGMVSYVGFGTDILGDTGEDGLGLLKKELLPRGYTFRMKFHGGQNDITQDVSVDPVVTWTMTRMLVQVNKSDGTRGINGVEVTYRGAWLETMGVTGDNGNGRVRKDLLPGIYKFNLKYMGGFLKEDNFEVLAGVDNELIIDGQEVTVELLDVSGGSPIDGGSIQLISADANVDMFGTTGDSGPGIVTHDVLPLVYDFIATYSGDTDAQNVDCTSGAWITFVYDDFPKSAAVGVKEDYQMLTYPNPFKGHVTIAFSLEEETDIDISIYDQTGRLIEILQDGIQTEGNHKINWDASSVNKGVYFVRMSSAGKVVHKNIVKM